MNLFVEMTGLAFIRINTGRLNPLVKTPTLTRIVLLVPKGLNVI